jgi:hypothetical protein
VYATIQEAKAAGAVPMKTLDDGTTTKGTMLSAPLAPPTGPIGAPAESLVVVTVKKFWQSKTAQAIKGVLVTAAAAVLLVFCSQLLTVWSSGKSVLDKGAIDWRSTERAGEIAGGGIIVAAVMAWARKHDNNAVQ